MDKRLFRNDNDSDYMEDREPYLENYNILITSLIVMSELEPILDVSKFVNFKVQKIAVSV